MITEALSAYQQQLQTYANLLEQQDWQGLSDAFARAKATRDALLP
jgi:prephenate dehydrogenase